MTDGGGFALALLPRLVLGAALAAALYAGLEEDAAAPPDTAPPAAVHLAAPDTDPPAAQPIDAWVSTILARPLFAPDRRPPARQDMPIEVELPRLIGVLVSPASRLAIFAGAAGGKPLVVAEGGSVGAHVLQSIRPGEAIMAGPRGQRILHTFGQGGGTPATGVPRR
jgi:general secretion pathway protein N